jgi:hypothetical protein
MDVGIALGIAAIIVAVVLPIGLEWLRRPRLEIRAARWTASGPMPWTFAVVHVRNRQLPSWVPLSRLTAESCRALVEFRRGDERDLAIPEIDARWSARPEPIKQELVDPPDELAQEAPGAKLVIQRFDPAAVPNTLTYDVPAGDRWEEIAIAILHQEGDAYGFGANSYQYPQWRNPLWQLDRRVYTVTVKLDASSVSKTQRFKLDYLKPDFARFKTSDL